MDWEQDIINDIEQEVKMSDAQWQMDKDTQDLLPRELEEWNSVKLKKDMTGVELIAQERLEQKVKHNRTLKYDAEINSENELTQAAIALLGESNYWMPESWDEEVCSKMLKKGYEERLVIAGALIAAEIDRLNYKE